MKKPNWIEGVIPLFEYSDYRDFLRDHYEHKKRQRAYYSYRFISARIGINPGFIARLFGGKVHIGLKKAPLLADLMELEGKEREFFLELVRFSRAKRDDEVRESLKRLQAIKGLEFKTLAGDQLAFFDKWHHMAIRSLLSIYPFNGSNYKKLGSRLIPALSATEVRESIKLQERLGLIRFHPEKKIYEVLDAKISTEEKWRSVAVHEYQKATLALSLNALETIPKNMRDISTVTFTCSSKHLESIRQRLSDLRQEMLMLSDDCPDEDCVMHLNLQLFPSAQIHGEVK